MTRQVTCAKTSDFTEVEDDLCDPRLRPESEKTCNEHPCSAMY